MPKSAHIFELTGGVLCLDFVNTVDHRLSPERFVDHLRSYGDLLVFGLQAGMFSRAERAQLERVAARNLAEARRVVRQAAQLREAIYRTFSALAAGRQPQQEDLGVLDRHAQAAVRHMRLQAANGGFRWQWMEQPTLEAPLWRIAKSAADLLTSAEAQAVRECAAETCGWLFVDRSRNHLRRWCDMKICGNRVKARRHYQRTRRA